MGTVETRPVGPAELADLERLFSQQRNTRHCWCMSFCATRGQLAAGWFSGGNQRRFAALAATSDAPMGVVASLDGEPVGWCACGPRSRYAAAIDGRGSVLAGRLRDEDEDVWLVPCVFVRDGYRGQGLSYALVRAGVALAREHRARAVEGWPVSGLDRGSGDDFVGREKVFDALGFRVVHRPTPTRVIMRLELG